MERELYKKKFETMLNEMVVTTGYKNDAYAAGSDAFANFRLIESMSNGLVNKELGVVTRMTDKLARVVNLLLTPDIEQNGESLSDNLLDLAVYACILRIMIQEKLNDEKELEEAINQGQQTDTIESKESYDRRHSFGPG